MNTMNLYKVNYDTYIAAKDLAGMERVFKWKYPHKPGYPDLPIKKVEVVSSNVLIPTDVDDIKTGGQNVSKNS